MDTAITGQPDAWLEHAHVKLQMFLADLLEDSVKASGLKATANEIGRTLISAMRGFKLVATDGKDLRRLIALQVALLISALGQHVPETHSKQKRGLAENNSRRAAASA